MRYLLLLALSLFFVSCTPGVGSMRQQLVIDTMNYTSCNQVQVNCRDSSCSNASAGAWEAIACGTKYKCTRAGEHVGCVPLTK